jgi:secreted trypsin-like serine protease
MTLTLPMKNLPPFTSFAPRKLVKCLTLILALLFSQLLWSVDTDERGITKDSHEIINGTPTTEGNQPWITALVYKNNDKKTPINQLQFCTGVLINEYWVLTAGHCIVDKDSTEMEVIVGRETLSSSTGQIHQVADIIPFIYYVRSFFYYDIGLVRLATPSAARPAELASTFSELPLFGSNLKAYGWGYKTYNKRPECQTDTPSSVPAELIITCNTDLYRRSADTEILLQTELTLHTANDCEARYKDFLRTKGAKEEELQRSIFNENNTFHMLCAWDHSDTTSVCFGDSGGPLIAMQGDRAIVVGVASHGYQTDCQSKGDINVFARIAYARSPLLQMMRTREEFTFNHLCPGELNPTVSYSDSTLSSSEVTLRWDSDSRASGYRLYYSAKGAVQAKDVQWLTLTGNTNNHFSVSLPKGGNYYAKVQAIGERCNGPMSALLTVTP